MLDFAFNINKVNHKCNTYSIFHSVFSWNHNQGTIEFLPTVFVTVYVIWKNKMHLLHDIYGYFFHLQTGANYVIKISDGPLFSWHAHSRLSMSLSCCQTWLLENKFLRKDRNLDPLLLITPMWSHSRRWRWQPGRWIRMGTLRVVEVESPVMCLCICWDAVNLAWGPGTRAPSIRTRSLSTGSAAGHKGAHSAMT